MKMMESGKIYIEKTLLIPKTNIKYKECNSKRLHESEKWIYNNIIAVFINP